MNVLTFRDFSWRSSHHMPSKHGAAAHPHWHSYRARFWFDAVIDQDELPAALECVFGRLHGCALNAIVQPDSSDEAVAEWLMAEAQTIARCVRVTLENDGQRGAEVQA